ncbi:hypothetical protein LEN26_009662, partial [Aphanomyces euteiches]
MCSRAKTSKIASCYLLVLGGVGAVRPVREDEVVRHRLGLAQYGYSLAHKVLLCTPGPGSYEYGIVDGQHRIAALKQLYEDPTLYRGAAFDNLITPEDNDIPHLPAYILENADWSDVLKVGYGQNNKMHRHGNGVGALCAIDIISKFVDWTQYKDNGLYSYVESGRKSNFTPSLVHEVFVRMQSSPLKALLSNMTDSAIKKNLYVVARAFRFGLLMRLLYEIEDPFNSKESWAFQRWQQNFETLNNYYWFFKRTCTPKWTMPDIQVALRLLLEGTLLVLGGWGLVGASQKKYLVIFKHTKKVPNPSLVLELL